MDTDQLIRTLAADNEHRSQPVGSMLAMTLLIALPISIMAFFTVLGFRPDILAALHSPFFGMKFAVTLSLAFSAAAISLHMSRPDGSLRNWIWLLLIPLALIGLGIMGEMMMAQSRPWLSRLVGSNSRICLTAIPALSLPLLAAALFALRHGAPVRPAVTGALAGLMSAGLAATLYASHCTDDSPLFVVTWYSLAIALVTMIGALAGSKVLKF
jgi:hypothetical protein